MTLTDSYLKIIQYKYPTNHSIVPAGKDFSKILPIEIILDIFRRLDLFTLMRLAKVNKIYRSLSLTPFIWRNLYMSIFRNSKIPLSAVEMRIERNFRELCLKTQHVANFAFLNKNRVVLNTIVTCSHSNFHFHPSSMLVVQIYKETHQSSCVCNRVSPSTRCHNKGNVWNMRSKTLLKSIELPNIPNFLHSSIDFNKFLLIGLIRAGLYTFIGVFDLKTNNNKVITYFPIYRNHEKLPVLHIPFSLPNFKYYSESNTVIYQDCLYSITEKELLNTTNPNTIIGYNYEDNIVFCNYSINCLNLIFNNHKIYNFPQSHLVHYEYDELYKLSIKEINLDSLTIVDHNANKTYEIEVCKRIDSEENWNISSFTYDSLNKVCIVACYAIISKIAKLKIFNILTRELLKTYDLKQDCKILSLKYDSVSKILMTLSLSLQNPKSNYALIFWDMTRGQMIRELKVGYNFEITKFEWVPDQSTLLVEAQDATEPNYIQTKIVKFIY